MKHLFVPYELALLAREKGFDEPCFGYQTDEYFVDFASPFINENNKNSTFYLSYPTAPLYQQLVDWFREKDIFIYVTDEWDSMGGYNRGFTPVVNNVKHYYDGDCFIEYYNALSIAITEAFKLI